MFRPAFAAAPTPPGAACARVKAVSGRWIAPLVAGACAFGAAHAQMVPFADNPLHPSGVTADFTGVRINIDKATATDDVAHGPGLNLRGKSFWPHWEGRIGMVIDRPVNPLKDAFVFAEPAAATGLHLRSMHVLSDYYVEGGFRATAGLLRGETGQAWWSTGDNGGGLNMSLQRLDTLGVLSNPANPSANANGVSPYQTMPYLGAGYTSRLTIRGTPSAWRFNADLGIITVNSNNINRIMQVFQGDKNLDDLVRDLRLRPIIKISVGYSF